MQHDESYIGVARKTALLLVALVPTALLGLLPDSAAGSTTISVHAEADTYVSSSLPDASFGSATNLYVDGSPARQTFLRFDVPDLGGQTIIDARLRMHVSDGSDVGGRIYTASSTGWQESVTWRNRPAVDGPQVGQFGAIAIGQHREADLGPFAPTAGKLTLAITSPSSDDARWTSREKGALLAPRLILEIDPAGGEVDGLSQITDALTGSSEPTYFGTQHRLAVTEAGRQLTVHGLHAKGVQLAWRDAAGNWQSQTRGAEANGTLLGDGGTGDWPASIAIARDSSGEEHAWVVLARISHHSTKPRPVYIRRLSELDSPRGPRVGPLVAVDSPALGAYMPDIAFEPAPGGGTRGVVVWSRKATFDTYETVTGWLTDLDTDQPQVHDRTVVDRGTKSPRWSTLVPVGGEMKLLARFGTNYQQLLGHESGAPLSSWQRSPLGPRGNGYASAVGLDSGQVVSVIETNLIDHTVRVQRYSTTGDALPAELSLTGYSTPSIATDGVRIWIVMVRQRDGSLVSREYAPDSGWTSEDRVEIASGAGPLAYPNLLRATDGRLRLVVEGPGDALRSAVLGYQRELSSDPTSAG